MCYNGGKGKLVKIILELQIFVYVIFEDEDKKNEEATIETQNDEDGYLWVENIPDGVECYVMLGD